MKKITFALTWAILVLAENISMSIAAESDYDRKLREMKEYCISNGGIWSSSLSGGGCSINSPTETSKKDCTYGPDTCVQGFVWRDAAPNDHVCVTPNLREQAHIDNSQANLRRSPTGGPYGPNTCIPGYVWRNAFDGDVVCVVPETRSQTAEANNQANSRKACR